jgi:hypothetical protein
MKHKKSLEEYRRLADKCRESARYLLSMAQTWDLIADRLEASRADAERSAVTDHDSPAVNVKPASDPRRAGSERGSKRLRAPI